MCLELKKKKSFFTEKLCWTYKVEMLTIYSEVPQGQMLLAELHGKWPWKATVELQTIRDILLSHSYDYKKLTSVSTGRQRS